MLPPSKLKSSKVGQMMVNVHSGQFTAGVCNGHVSSVAVRHSANSARPWPREMSTIRLRGSDGPSSPPSARRRCRANALVVSVRLAMRVSSALCRVQAQKVRPISKENRSSSS